MTKLLFFFLACFECSSAPCLLGTGTDTTSSSAVFNVAPGGVGTITIAFWCNNARTNYFPGTTGITQKGNTGSNNERLFEIRVNGASSNNVEFIYRDSGFAFHTFSGPPHFLRETNQYRHVAFCYTYGTGSSAKFYFDGVLQTGFSWTAGSGNVAPYTNTDSFTFGGSISSGWVGKIEEFGLWNTALTSYEIQTLCNSKVKLVPLQTKPQNLICYYRCNVGVERQAIPQVAKSEQDLSHSQAHALIEATPIGCAEQIVSFLPNE